MYVLLYKSFFVLIYDDPNDAHARMVCARRVPPSHIEGKQSITKQYVKTWKWFFLFFGKNVSLSFPQTDVYTYTRVRGRSRSVSTVVGVLPDRVVHDGVVGVINIQMNYFRLIASALN